MAVVSLTGFEAQSGSAEQITLSGTTSFSTSIFRSGAASLRCNPASGATGNFQIASVQNNYVHFGLYIATAPSVARLLAGSTGANNANLLLNTDGSISLRTDTTVVGTTSALSTGTWYWIGVKNKSLATGVLMQVDGTDAFSGTYGTNTFAILGFTGTEASAVDCHFDDVLIDGAGFLASSKVDLALPISDNTRTNVTGGAGGTTNLWDAVNNTPPAGVASASETNTTNIEFPASLTESYIANLETYTTLGIVSGDTVLATQGVIRHGEDIATGTKNGTYVGTTNPTQTDNTAFTFGNDGGAHGAEVGLWVSLTGTIVTSPSVTLGTSPTIQVDRASQTRVGCIDFMGMNVAWTPAAAAVASLLPPHRHRGLIVR